MPDYRDRSFRLSAFGILTILGGCGSLLLAVFYLLLPLAGALVPETAAISTGSVLSGIILHTAIGALLIWAGLGSLRKRRWVRSLMLTISWGWLLCGVILVPASLFLLEDLLPLSAGADQAPEVLLIARLFMLAAGIGMGIVLPGAFIYIYRDHDLLLTCEAHDPRPGWADRCPGSVLGLSLSLAALGIMAIPLALTPAVPLFGLLVTGWSGAGLTLLLGLLSLFLARSVYRLESLGWWGTTLLLLLIGISTVITFASEANLEELLSALGYTELQAAAILPTSRLLVLWSTIPITLASLGYMGFIRKEFGGESSSDG
jgi:hypothetical protein